MTAEDPRIETIRDGISEEWETRPAGSTNPLSALDSLAADLEAARAALAGAIDGAESYAEVAGVLIFDTEKARAALARLSAGKEGA